jgi:hypothetical protein
MIFSQDSFEDALFYWCIVGANKPGILIIRFKIHFQTVTTFFDRPTIKGSRCLYKNDFFNPTSLSVPDGRNFVPVGVSYD